MNLKLILPIKKITINGKQVSIPRLGIKQYQEVRDIESPIEILEKLVWDIKPHLTIAEYDLMIIHLLEFNDRLKTTIDYKGETLNINDVYISQNLKFQFQGKVFEFKEPPRIPMGTADVILKDLYLGDEDIDFLEMPAFVYKWLNSIINTLSIKTKNNGIISGANTIMELFANE